MALAALLVGLTVGLRTAWLSDRARVEADAARDSHRRLVGELARLSDRLAATVSDWATWDATFDFAQGRKPEYLRDELDNVATYTRLVFDVAVVFDPSGNPVAGRVLRGTTVAERPARYWAAAFWRTLVERAIAAPGPRTGIAVLDEGTAMLAAHGIHRRVGARSELAGVLVFGRFIDERVRASIAGSESVELTFHPLSLPGAGPEELAAAAEIAQGAPLLVRTEGHDTIAVYSVLPDVEGRPALVVRSRSERVLWREALAATRLVLGTAFALALLFGALGLTFLDRAVLQRLTAIGEDLNRIRASRDPGARVAVTTRDELGALQRAINELLEALQQAERERAQSADHLRRHEAIVFAAERIVCLHSWEEGAPVILARLGEAASASRVALFEFGSPDPLSSCHVRCGWAKHDVGEPAPPISCPRLRDLTVRLSLGTSAEVRWTAGDREDRELLDQRRAGSILLVPVFAEGRLWGAICAEDIDRSRTWSAQDREALAAAAKMIGAALAADVARRELLEAKHVAETAALAKGEFLATMSHEIRTPLNAVIGLSELALETHDPSERATYLRLVRSSAQSLLTLVNNILDFSRLDAGRLEVERIDFDVHQWVTDVASSFKQQARHKGLGFAARVGTDVPRFISGDPGRLRQVLVNLLGNALKFTQKGQVTLRVSVAEKAASSLQLLFEVRDTGIGIPLEKLDSVFQPFTQADSTTTRRFGGTGLGLAISQSLVRLMGGRIWVESRVGEGSAFSFTARFGHATSSEETISGPVHSIKHGLCVLLAEDNDVNQLLARRLLEREGHTVTAVATGAAAVEACATSSFDFVLMDIQMPVMDGLAATAAIRAQERGSGTRVPIIAMTASAMPGDRERCLAAGMDGYIAKPVKIKELLAEINRVLALVS